MFNVKVWQEKLNEYVNKNVSKFRNFSNEDKLSEFFVSFLVDNNGCDLHILKPLHNHLYKVVDKNQNVFFIQFELIDDGGYYPYLTVSNCLTVEEFDKKKELLNDLDQDFLTSLLFFGNYPISNDYLHQ